jgi:hypothetical protein
MQKPSIPKIRKNAGATVASDLPKYLITAEECANRLHAKTVALSQILGPHKDLSGETWRLISAAVEVAGKIESQALETVEAVEDAFLIASQTVKFDMSIQVGKFTKSFKCSHDQMCGFTDDLLDIIDELAVIELAITNTAWVGSEDIESMGCILERSFQNAKALRGRTNSCFDTLDGRPGRRHDRAAEAGAA